MLNQIRKKNYSTGRERRITKESANCWSTFPSHRLYVVSWATETRECSSVIDVQRNIATVSSLLKVAENEYLASQIPNQPDLSLEEGLPLTEIYEELDEEGNVICMCPSAAIPTMTFVTMLNMSFS